MNAHLNNNPKLLSPSTPPPHPALSLFSPSESNSLQGFLADFAADPISISTPNPLPPSLQPVLPPSTLPPGSFDSLPLPHSPNLNLNLSPDPALPDASQPPWMLATDSKSHSQLPISHYPTSIHSHRPLQIVVQSKSHFVPHHDGHRQYTSVGSEAFQPLRHFQPLQAPPQPYTSSTQPPRPLFARQVHGRRTQPPPTVARRSLSGSSGSSQTTRPAQACSSASSTASSSSATKRSKPGSGVAAVPAAVLKKEKPGLLSQEQKRANHIASEQKRRAAIREGYGRLCVVVPSLRAPAGGEEWMRRSDEDSGAEEERDRAGWRKKAGRDGPGAKRKRKKAEGLEPRPGAKSEAVVLAKTVEYLRELDAERNSLVGRLKKAELLASAHGLHVEWTGRRRAWEEKWRRVGAGMAGGLGGDEGESEGVDENRREDGWLEGMDE